MIQALVLLCAAQAGAPLNPLELLDAPTVGKIMAHKPIATLLSKSGLHPHVDSGAQAALSPLTATDFKAGPRRLPDQVVAGDKLDEASKKNLLDSMNSAMDGFERTQRPHNVATALAWLLFNAAEPYTHSLSKMSDAQGDTAVAAINDELAASAVFRKMSDADKQRLYEMCLTTAAGLIGYQKSNDVESGKKLGKIIIETFANAPR